MAIAGPSRKLSLDAREGIVGGLSCQFSCPIQTSAPLWVGHREDALFIPVEFFGSLLSLGIPRLAVFL